MSVCREIEAKLIYISTDYVFPGTGDREHGTDDPTGPLGVFGRTKIDGELAVREFLQKYFIVRISWVFGKNGSNFVKTMLRLGKERDTVRVVCDQFGSPTYTADLAPLLCDMAATEKYGIYHATNEGFCSWAEFAQEIFRQAGYATRVDFIPSSEYPAKALRPLNSRLSKRSLDIAGFRMHQDAVTRYPDRERQNMREGSRLYTGVLFYNSIYYLVSRAVFYGEEFRCKRKDSVLPGETDVPAGELTKA